MLKNKNLLTILTLLLLVLVSFIFVTASKINVLDFVNHILNSSYKPNYNYIEYGRLGRIPINLFSLAVIFTTALLLSIIRHTLADNNTNVEESQPFSRLLMLSLFTFLPIWLSIQSYSHLETWKSNFKNYANRTQIEQFEGLGIGISYETANFYLKHLERHHRTAILATDLDLSRDPGMIMQRSLAYYLYPLDIRNVRRDYSDTWIAFEKLDARQYVPKGYTIIAELDSNNLIAIKDRP